MRKKWKLLINFIKLCREDDTASFNIVTNSNTIVITTNSIGNNPKYKLKQLRLNYK